MSPNRTSKHHTTYSPLLRNGPVPTKEPSNHSPHMSHRTKPPPPSSASGTTGGISSFSDDDEDWEAATGGRSGAMDLWHASGIVLEDKQTDDKTKVGSSHHIDNASVHAQKACAQNSSLEVKKSAEEEPVKGVTIAEQGLSSPSSVVTGDLVARNGLQQQVTSLQQQLFAFSQSLSGIVGAHGPTLSDDARLAFYEKEYPHLRTLNDALQGANTRLRAQVGDLRAQLHEAKEGKAWKASKGEVTRSNVGIDPEKIQDLAIDLSTGTRDVNDIADAMFALIDKATPYPCGPEEVNREKLAPRERLRNLEGVVDVSLGRMETLENRVSMIVHPDWRADQPRSGASMPTRGPMSDWFASDTRSSAISAAGDMSGYPLHGKGVVLGSQQNQDDDASTEDGRSVRVLDLWSGK